MVFFGVIIFLSVFLQMQAQHIVGGKVLSGASAPEETSPHNNTVTETAPALSIRSVATEPAAVPGAGKGE